MKTMVLGGTGFVGRRLVEILTTEGARVTVLNRGVTPVELPPGVARLVADRSDAPSIRAALAGAAVVDQALSDPLWGRTFDFAYEAEVAALARAR